MQVLQEQKPVTHLTDTTNQQADALINTLMDGFAIAWKRVK